MRRTAFYSDDNKESSCIAANQRVIAQVAFSKICWLHHHTISGKYRTVSMKKVRFGFLSKKRF